MTRILALDIAGSPWRWLDIERAIYYAATDKVAWSLGDPALHVFGGTRRDGQRSSIALPPIIALAKSEIMVRFAQKRAFPLGTDNAPLFARDLNVCAYCGDTFHARDLTREHIVPRGQGGRDVWMNVVTACRPCNERKGCRTPEQARMPLLYVPYTPCAAEHCLMSGRGVLADQMEYLKARLPRHSRLN